jgi:hypothetical protein
MAADRYVVLGLARPRAEWFRDITRWATAAALPIEFVKCLTVDETRARLASGRRWSALVLDASVPGADRDLIEAARSAGAVVLIAPDPRTDRAWSEMGAAAVLPAAFGRDDLLAALAEHSRPITRVTPRVDQSSPVPLAPWRGRLVAVTGPGGTGASTLAAMLAQGFGTDVRDQGLVLLADLALHADQAVLHDAGDVMPGLPELVDAHRLGTPEPDEIRALTFVAESRGYELLLGLRRHRDWTTLRPRAVAAAIDGLRRSYRVIVADIDDDIEGEHETGSSDVEDRNVLARAAVDVADAVLVVGSPGPVGIHRLARLIRELVAGGVPPQRVLPVVNRGPRSVRARAELAEALSRLTGPACADVASPITVADRRRLDELIRLGGRWPDTPVRALHHATIATLDRPVDDHADDHRSAPQLVRPGELGHYHGPDIDEGMA